MTEAEWVSGKGTPPLLEFLQGTASERKLRLFTSACCRQIWTSLLDVRCRAAVELAERMADGLTTGDYVAIAEEDARAAARVGASFAPVYLLSTSFMANQNSTSRWALSVALACIETLQRLHPKNRRGAVGSAEALKQVSLLRDIFGNPFRPVAFSAEWRTSTAIALAQQMYESRDFSAMPILADALQDAGCDNDDILNHCRGDGPHVRGCWVVDLVLGKE